MLKKNAEVARFTQFVLGAVTKKEKNAKYKAIDLKNDLVREIKTVRGVLGDEKLYLPKALMSEVLSIVWSAR